MTHKIDSAIQSALDMGMLDLARDLNRRTSQEDKEFVPFSDAALRSYMEDFGAGPLRKSIGKAPEPKSPESLKQVLRAARQGEADRRSLVIQEFKGLLGPLVNPLLRTPEGELDLTKIKVGNFEDFKRFLKAQVSMDGIAFNGFFLDSYHKVLAKKEFEGLLYLIYREIHPQDGEEKVPGQDPKDPFPFMAAGWLPVTALAGFKSRPGPEFTQSPIPEPSPEAAWDSLKRFTAALIEISPEKFVGNFLGFKAGRERLARILQEPAYLKNLQVDLMKAIGAMGNQLEISPLHSYQLDIYLNSWDVFNGFTDEEKIKKARYHALELLKDGNDYQEFSEAQQQKYLESPEKIRIFKSDLLQRPLSPQDVKKMAQRAQEEGAALDSLSQLKSKIAAMWLLAVDEEHWIYPENYGATENNRVYLIQQLAGLLHQADGVADLGGFEEFNERLQDFLHGASNASGSVALNWILHKTVGHGLEDIFVHMPSAYKAPYLDLLQYSDEIVSAKAMNEPVVLKMGSLNAQDPQLKKGIEHLIDGLEHTKRSLWYQYKQHKAVSRAASNIASLWSGGDMADIRAANGQIDQMIERLKGASTKMEVEAELDQLTQALKEDGILHRAFVAAEMDGYEQLIGITQTVAIILGTTLISGGSGTAVAVGRAGFLAQFPQMAGYGLKMGAWMGLVENGIAVGTGEVRGKEDNLLSWAKDSAATGMAMALFAPISMGATPLVASRNAASGLIKRYFTSGWTQGITHWGRDSLAGTTEQMFQEQARRAMDGQWEFMGWDQARGIALVSALGSAKMGALAEGYRIMQGVAPSLGEPRSFQVNLSPELREIELNPDGPRSLEILTQEIRRVTQAGKIKMYVWRGDEVGVGLAEEVLGSAERGVKWIIEKDRGAAPIEHAELSRRSVFHPKLNFVEGVTSWYLHRTMRDPQEKDLSNQKQLQTILNRFIDHPNIEMDRDVNYKDHAKFWDLDGQVMITGGRNVGREDYGIWNDYSVILRSPELIQRFYARRHGEVPFDPNALVDFAFNVPGRFELLDVMLEQLYGARHEILMQMAYFGHPKIFRAMVDAAKRIRTGRLHAIIPETAIIQDNLNKQFMHDLLEKTGGAWNVHLYPHPRMAHGKVVHTDGVRTNVGSTNLNATIVVLGEANTHVNSAEALLTQTIRRSLQEYMDDSTLVRSSQELQFSRMKAGMEHYATRYQKKVRPGKI
jgi:phosphatidylserine/phosphatidylglycerophosphate/cardiolipin synthase-like enzyme